MFGRLFATTLQPGLRPRGSLSHGPVGQRLPYAAQGHIQGRQPVAAVAAGIHALHITEIEDFAVMLRPVAADRNLAGAVGAEP